MSKPIKTRRLVLRELKDSDVPEIARLSGDWDIARMTARIPFPYSEALAREWMSTIAEDEFVRVIMHEGALVGCCGYILLEDSTAEIGYWVGKPWWGRGFATEAASALVHHCFTRASLKKLTCCHFVDNPASARVIAKLGFKATDSCLAWCDARNEDVATQNYELDRPLSMMFWRRAG
jgi:RimJ/RimL family protein N-acetyltransferase